MDKSISDSSAARICRIRFLSSHSTSLYSNSLSIEGDREPGFDLISVCNGDARSRSLPDPPGDRPLLSNFLVSECDLDLDDLLPLPKTESSMVDMVVANVAVEFEQDENFMRLPSAVAVVWVIVEALLEAVFDLLCPLIEPPKRSLFVEPGLLLKRLRDIASKPKIWALERKAAVGVGGADILPVRNLNRPN